MVLHGELSVRIHPTTANVCEERSIPACVPGKAFLDLTLDHAGLPLPVEGTELLLDFRMPAFPNWVASIRGLRAGGISRAAELVDPSLRSPFISVRRACRCVRCRGSDISKSC
jgi:hypothetical protein